MSHLSSNAENGSDGLRTRWRSAVQWMLDLGLWPPLVIVVVLNGALDRIISSIRSNGLVYAVSTTFNVSVLIWIAAGFAIVTLSRVPHRRYGPMDYLVVTVSCVLCLIPDSRIAWVALTLIGLHLSVTGSHTPQYRAAGEVLIGMSFVGLWSKAIMRVFLDYVLHFDTVLVSLLTHLPYSGNLIFTGTNGVVLEVGEECSAFQNLAIVVLSWVVFRLAYGATGWLRTVVVCLASALVVVAINTLRIGIIAWRPDLYDIAHGPIGATIAGNFTALAVCVICYLGAQKSFARI